MNDDGILVRSGDKGEQTVAPRWLNIRRNRIAFMSIIALIPQTEKEVTKLLQLVKLNKETETKKVNMKDIVVGSTIDLINDVLNIMNRIVSVRYMNRG